MSTIILLVVYKFAMVDTVHKQCRQKLSGRKTCLLCASMSLRFLPHPCLIAFISLPMLVLFVLLILTRSLNVLLHISYPFYHDIQCFQIELIASMVLFRQIERLNFYFTLLFLYLITQLPHIFSKLV